MKGSTITSTLHQALIPKRLQDKVVIITGGASGIGAATATLFAKHGAKVIVADLKPPTADNSGSDISYVHCDVTNESDIENAVDTAVSTHGRLDIMFSNAGIMESSYPTISSFDRATFNAVFNTNVYGAFLAAKHAARVMVPRRRGSILFTASVVTAQVHGQAPHVYTASKHAVVGLAKNLAVEMGPHGIRVNCISPFGVATPLAMGPSGMDEDAFKGVIDQIANLKGASLEAEDVAEAAVYLGSDEAKYVSGMNLVIDGAYGLKCAT